FQLFGVPAFFLMAALYHFGIKERRERFLALLPVPVRHRSLALLLPFAILFHIGVLSAWTTQLLRAPDELANEFITLSGVLTLNGITICLVFIIIIRLSLNFNKSAHRRIANIALWIILISGILLFFSFKISFQRYPEFHALIRDLLFHSPAVAVAANAVCAGLMYLSMVIYARRRSYLA
ncbi:MAG: hypothetical protein ACREOI_38600, partial [bacterium]